MEYKIWWQFKCWKCLEDLYGKKLLDGKAQHFIAINLAFLQVIKIIRTVFSTLNTQGPSTVKTRRATSCWVTKVFSTNQLGNSIMHYLLILVIEHPTPSQES